MEKYWSFSAELDKSKEIVIEYIWLFSNAKMQGLYFLQ